jgi:uncharacterized protein (DUF1501 family)
VTNHFEEEVNMALDFSRRDFLKIAATGLTGWTLAPQLPAWMPRLAFAAEDVEPQGDVLVCVFQRGGMDGLNAVIPHGEAEYYRRRPTLAVPEPKSGDDTTGVDLDGFFGLHPALRQLKDLWDDKALAIVHATGSPDPTHSHFDAMDYMERGTPGEKSLPTGWIGRHLQTAPWQNQSPFRAVGMGGAAQASLRGPVPVTVLKSIADFHLAGRTQDLAEIQQTLTALYTLKPALAGSAESTFEAIGILEKVDVTSYTPEQNAQYPEGDFGLALMQVAQLAKAEVGLEVACVDIGGWDTHAAQGGVEGELPGLLTQLASGLTALYRDLGDRAKRVTIVTMSEFGRRVQENGSAGTDHGHGNAMFVLGGGVNGGKVYGEWPTLAPEALADPGDLAITTDFRDVLGEIVQKRLANPKLAEVFPGYTDWKMRGVVREGTA